MFATLLPKVCNYPFFIINEDYVRIYSILTGSIKAVAPFMGILAPLCIAAYLWQCVCCGGNKSLAIPGNPRGKYPILGDTPIILNPRTMGSYQVSSQSEHKCPIWRTSFLFQPSVFVSGHSNLQALSKEELSKKKSNTAPCFPPHHLQLFGKHSILVTSGHEHKLWRNVIVPVLQPNFYKEEIQLSARAFVEGCRQKKTSSIPGGKVHDSNGVDDEGYFPLVPELKKFTLRVMLRIILGEHYWKKWTMTLQENSSIINSGTMPPRLSKLESLLSDIAIWSEGILSPPTSFIPFTPAYRAMQARKRIKKVLLEIIEKERGDMQDQNTQHKQEGTKNENRHGKKSLIRRLLVTSLNEQLDKTHQSKATNMHNEAMIDNLLTLLFAGTDTTASILSSAFLVLSNNPKLRQRLQASINGKGCNNDKHVKVEKNATFSAEQKGGEEDTPKEYTDDYNTDEILTAFVSEVQRCYPAAPFTVRKIVPQEKINKSNSIVGAKSSVSSSMSQKDGIHLGEAYGTVPPGFLIIYAIVGTLLNDEESYPNPREFDMNRWLRKKTSSVHHDQKQHQHHPPTNWAFGGGHRVCPGRFLTNAESVELLRQVLSDNANESAIDKGGWKWELKPNQDLEYLYTPGFFPKDGLLIRICD